MPISNSLQDFRYFLDTLFSIMTLPLGLLRSGSPKWIFCTTSDPLAKIEEIPNTLIKLSIKHCLWNNVMAIPFDFLGRTNRDITETTPPIVQIMSRDMSNDWTISPSCWAMVLCLDCLAFFTTKLCTTYRYCRHSYNLGRYSLTYTSGDKSNFFSSSSGGWFSNYPLSLTHKITKL